MSGHKHATITISEDEYRRLQEAEMKLRSERKERADQAMTMYTHDVFTKAYASMEQRQAFFEQEIASLDSVLSDLERETAHALIAQQSDLYLEFAEKMNNSRENTAQMIDEIAQGFQNMLEKQHHRHQNQLSNVNQQLINIRIDQRQKYTLAENWINYAYTLREFIENQYDYNRFVPGQTQKLDNELTQARENLGQGMSEAAFIGAQQVYTSLSVFRLEIEKVMSEWQVLFHTTYRNARRLDIMAKENREVPAIDTDGNEIPFQIKIIDWAGQEYLLITQQINDILNKLRNDAHQLSIQDLRNYLYEVLPKLEKDLDNIIYQSRLEVINSQIRINIADLALQALEKQGFVLDQCGYINNDRRKSFFASVRNIEGSEVVIYVDPARENVNNIVIDSKDRIPRTEHELRKRFQDIAQTLLQYGLQVGAMQVDYMPETDRVFKPNSYIKETQPPRLLDTNDDRKNQTTPETK